MGKKGTFELSFNSIASKDVALFTLKHNEKKNLHQVYGIYCPQMMHYVHFRSSYSNRGHVLNT